MLEISGYLVTHDIDLEVVVGYLFVPYRPFRLDGLTLRRMDIERRFRKRIDLFNQTRWENYHGASIDTGQNEGTVYAGKL